MFDLLQKPPRLDAAHFQELLVQGRKDRVAEPICDYVGDDPALLARLAEPQTHVVRIQQPLDQTLDACLKPEISTDAEEILNRGRYRIKSFQDDGEDIEIPIKIDKNIKGRYVRYFMKQAEEARRLLTTHMARYPVITQLDIFGVTGKEATDRIGLAKNFNFFDPHFDDHEKENALYVDAGFQRIDFTFLRTYTGESTFYMGADNYRQAIIDMCSKKFATGVSEEIVSGLRQCSRELLGKVGAALSTPNDNRSLPDIGSNGWQQADRGDILLFKALHVDQPSLSVDFVPGLHSSPESLGPRVFMHGVGFFFAPR